MNNSTSFIISTTALERMLHKSPECSVSDMLMLAELMVKVKLVNKESC